MGQVSNPAVSSRRSAERIRFRSTEPVARAYDDWSSFTAERGSTLFDLVTRRDEHVGFFDATPWPTFVLGSGCLSPLPGGTSGDSDLRAVIERGFESGVLPQQRRSDGDTALTYEFITALVELKLEQSAAPTDWLVERAEASDVFPWSTTLRVCLLAAMATRAYTSLVSLSTPVLGRADREVVVYDPVDTPLLTRAFRELVAPMDELALALQRGVPGTGAAWDSFKSLLSTLDRKVDGRRELRRQQIELLGAFAWHFLTDGTEIYPGWSDILLFHAFELDARAFGRIPVPQRARTRPAVLGHGTWMYRRLRKVTERSIRTPEPLYDSVAAVLVQQAELLRSWHPAQNGGREDLPRPDVPLASAFVSSFDIELELALSARAKRFAIVIPVVEKSPRGGPSPDTASVQWLYRVFTVADGESRESILSRLLDVATEWSSMSGSPLGMPPEIARLPIVVHLSGAPLFSIPRAVGGGGELSHALLLDETLAIIQFGAEVQLQGQGTDRLPGRLVTGPEDPRSPQRRSGHAGPRFWTFVGNPHSDPAVRLRLLASGWGRFVRDQDDRGGTLNDKTETEAVIQRQNGLVLNRWVPAGEGEAFRWQNLDVVQGRASDLETYVAGFTDRVRHALDDMGAVANG